MIVWYLNGPHMIARFALVILACEAALYYSDAYSSLETKSGLEVFMGLLQALGIACLVLAIVY